MKQVFRWSAAKWTSVRLPYTLEELIRETCYPGATLGQEPGTGESAAKDTGCGYWSCHTILIGSSGKN